MNVQVVVTKDDRHWDAIRDEEAQALFRVTEHMMKTGGEGIVQIAKTANLKLIFGKLEETKAFLIEHNFQIEVRHHR